MIEELKRPDRLDEDKLEALKDLFPHVFTEGRINFDALREELAENLDELEPGDEHYGLNWPGKRKAKRLASMPPSGTLRPAPGEGMDEDTTKNLIIEGDNLEVLRIMQKAYAGRVKVIYIDPPYNTGNDFVYKDDFKDPVETFLQRSGQSDEDGLLVSNPKSSGRYHSNWLSMMYPRLRLARNLLKDDGAIFVSIDNNEMHNLRGIMDEIFGEENFVTVIEWQKRYTRSNNTVGFTSVTEHILLYQRTENFIPNLLDRDEDADARYTNPDNDPRGPWKGMPFSNPKSPEERPNLAYTIINPNTGEAINPTRKAWRSSKSVFEKYEQEKRVYWGLDGASASPSIKMFLSDARGLTPINFWDHRFAGNTDNANAEVQNLFGDKVFDTPKPTLLVRRVLQVATSRIEEDIILDFYAGSGTTAEAVMKENAEDSGNRRFILVQLPEKIDQTHPAHKAGFQYISQITTKRILLAASKRETRNSSFDVGFQALRLDRSFRRKWQGYEGTNLHALGQLYESLESPFVDNWTPEGVLTEVMLLEGYPLDSDVRQSDAFAGNTVHEVKHPELETKLLVCLDELLADSTIKGVSAFPKDVFVCLDKALTDETKLRLSNSLRVRTL